MKRYWFALLPALALIVAGCATTGEAGSSEEETVEVEVESMSTEAVYIPPQVPHQLNSVAMLSDSLVKDLLVTRHSYSRNPSNTFQVNVTLKNVTDDALHLLVRTQYFDSDRMSQEGPGEWAHVFIPAQGIETYSTNSISTKLDFYYVEVMKM